MVSINKKSFLLNANEPVEKRVTPPSPKEVSNKNYLFKQTSPLNSILSANKKTLGPQEVSWMTATKTALASTGVFSALGLSYLGYQYFGTKPIPSPSVLPYLPMRETAYLSLVGVSITTIVLLWPVLPALTRPCCSSELPEEYKNFFGKQMMERFVAADKGFKTNIDEFVMECDDVIRFLNSPSLPKQFIESFLLSIQKKITKPDNKIDNHIKFNLMMMNLFRKLNDIDTDWSLDSALEIAKICVTTKSLDEDYSWNGQSFRNGIIEKALYRSKRGLALAVHCAKQKYDPQCQRFAIYAATQFFYQKNQLFAELLKEIAQGDNEHLQESILATGNLSFSKNDEAPETEACTKIQEIFDIFIEAKNYKMATSLLEKCITAGGRNLQKMAEVWFYEHEIALTEYSPLAANRLSNHFQKALNKSIKRSYDLAKEETLNDISEQQSEILLLNG